MKFCIFDIETNGLLPDVSIFHVLYYVVYSFENGIEEEGYITDPIEVLELFEQDYIFVGHNIIKYDVPAIEKLFDCKLENLTLIDTLGLSWYLYSYLKKHGLEAWGIILGINKIGIEDWSNLTQEQYIERCKYDVMINLKLFIKQWNDLLQLYEDPFIIIRYLNFKLECLRDQEFVGLPLNIELTQQNLDKLTKIFDEKTQLLEREMPRKLGKLIKTKPKAFYKKDYTISASGLKYIQELVKRGLPIDSEEIRDLPNPGSTDQLKAWLFSLGWQPITFKVSDATGEQVPQVSLPFGQGLCESIKDMFEEHPVLEELDTYHKIKHRIGILKSYLEQVDKNGNVIASAQGFTKTLRLKHSKPIANLPKPSVLYGAEVREVLTVPNTEDYIMCGCDISGLESTTQDHYISFYDPDYVAIKRQPGFDAHTDIATLANLMTTEEEKFFKWFEQKNM